MPEGPFGGPRPFAQGECSPLLSLNIQVDGNRWEYASPEGYDKLMTAIGDGVRMTEQNIFLRESRGPAEGHDFYGYVRLTGFEYFDSVARKVESLEEELESLDGIDNVGVILDAGDPEQKIRE